MCVFIQIWLRQQKSTLLGIELWVVNQTVLPARARDWNLPWIRPNTSPDRRLSHSLSFFVSFSLSVWLKATWQEIEGKEKKEEDRLCRKWHHHHQLLLLFNAESRSESSERLIAAAQMNVRNKDRATYQLPCFNILIRPVMILSKFCMQYHLCESNGFVWSFLL